MLLWAPLAFGAYRGWPLAVAEILVLVGALAWGLQRALAHRLEWRRTALDLPLALLVLLVLVQLALGNRPLVSWALAPAGDPHLAAALPALLVTVGTVAPVQTARSLLLFLTYAGVYFLIVHLTRERRDLDRLVRRLLLLGGVLAFLGLADFLAGETWLLAWREHPFGGRLSGTFVNPDHFAAWLSMLICLGLGHLAARRGSRREKASLLALLGSRNGRETMIRTYLPFFAVLVMAIALILTLSRGAILSLVATLVVFMILMSAVGRMRWSLVLVGSLTAGALAYAAWIGLQPLLARVHEGGYAGRLIQSLSSLPMLRTFPVLGVGLGAYKDIYFRYQPPSLEPGKVYFPYAHNDLLQVALELGVVGTVVVLFALSHVTRDLVGAHLLGRGRCPAGGGRGEGARRNDPFSLGIAVGGVAGVLALLVQSAFDFSARIPANGILGAACLAIATTALHTRFGNPPVLLTTVHTRSLSGTTSIVACALAVTLALTLVVAVVRPALVEDKLRTVAGPSALRRLDEALALDSREPRALRSRAELRLEAVKRLPDPQGPEALALVHGAVADLRTALAETPTDPFLHERLGWAYAAQAAIEGPADSPWIAAAVVHLRRALALAPENPLLYRSLAALTTTLPRSLLPIGLEAAREAGARDPQLLPDLVDRFLPLGLRADEWLALVPDTAIDRLQLGTLLESKGLVPEAVAAYRRAVEVARDEEALARWVLAKVLQGLRKAQAALLELDAAIGRDPDNPELHLARGDVLAAQGDPAALDAYRTAVAKAEAITRATEHDTLPFHPKAARTRALIGEHLGPGEQLTTVRYRRALARSLTDRKLWEQALETWSAVVAEAPSDASGHFSLGVTLDGLGATDKALEAYRQAVALDGRRGRFRMRLAERLWATDQYYQAINEWRTVVQQEPDNVAARMVLARAYLKIGEKVLALQEFLRVLQITPDNPDARREAVRLGALPGS